MYETDDLEISRLERESARIRKAMGATAQSGDLIAVGWLPGSNQTGVPPGWAKGIRSERVAELSNAIDRLREQDVVHQAEACLLSQARAREYFVEFKAYWNRLRQGKKALLILAR